MSWTKAQLSAKVLEYLGVKPAGQAASAHDLNLVSDVVDSVYDQLQDSDLAPYGIAEIPAWAQQPMVKYVAVEAGPYFGKVYPEDAKSLAVKEMARSRFGGPKSTLPTSTKDY
jgi:hypothetical protein